jgi:transposase InsO family protein
MQMVFESLEIQHTYAVRAVLARPTSCPSLQVFVAQLAPVSWYTRILSAHFPYHFLIIFRYMATFLDDYSRYVVVALMKKKSDIGVAFASFRRFLSQTAKLRDDMVINIEFEDTDMLPNYKFSEGFHVTRLHSDNAKEYKHIEDREAHKDINKTYSEPYTPQHNSIAERVNRTIMDPVRSMLIHAGLPDTLWPYTVKNVVKV